MGVRNVKAGTKVKEEILDKIPSAKIDVMDIDLNSQASIRKFDDEYISSTLPLNLLINNAGIMAPPFTLSKDNIEQQFAVNHIGPFLLTKLLLETMKKTALESMIEGRIVNIGSEVHRYSYREGIRFDKINDKLRIFVKTMQQGAATTCYLALNPQVKEVSVEYFTDCNKAETSAIARDPEMAKKLWSLKKSK